MVFRDRFSELTTRFVAARDFHFSGNWRYRRDRDSRRRRVSRARMKEVVDRGSDKLRIVYHPRRRSRGLLRRIATGSTTGVAFGLARFSAIFRDVPCGDAIQAPTIEPIIVGQFPEQEIRRGRTMGDGHLVGKRVKRCSRKDAIHWPNWFQEILANNEQAERKRPGKEAGSCAQRIQGPREFSRGFRIIQPAFHEHAQPICRAVNS